jgi:hypothetical protein
MTVPATNTHIHGRDTETHSFLRAIIAYRAHGMQGWRSSLKSEHIIARDRSMESSCVTVSIAIDYSFQLLQDTYFH